MLDTEHTRYVISNRRLLAHELNFIKKVRDAATASGVEKGKWKAKDISYFKFRPGMEEQQGKIYNVCEIDVTGAYWNLAHNMGIISDEVFQKGLKVDKSTRLIAFGSLATNKRVFEYDVDTADYEHIADVKDDLLRSYFFLVAKKLDDLMTEICERVEWKGFYFYWVDAFFCDELTTDYIVDFFSQTGLEVKKKVLSCLHFSKHKGGDTRVYTTEIKERHEDRTDIRIKYFSQPGDKIPARIVESFLKNIQNERNLSQ
jgi:hypothetical protein